MVSQNQSPTIEDSNTVSPQIATSRATASGRSAIERSYIPGIDGLRGISVLAVLLFHLNAALLPGGFVGVDVFFVISGFVVTKSILQNPGSTFIEFALHFYRRRILRILPALVLCLVVLSALSVIFIPAGNLGRFNDLTALASFFGLSNFALWVFSEDYFSLTTEFNPFTHTWSLGVEEQFYFVFPALIFLFLRATASGARRWSGVFAAVCMLSLAAAAIVTPAQRDMAFYLLPFRFWELGCGALLYLLLRGTLETDADSRRRSGGLAPLMLSATAAGALAVAFTLADPVRFPFPWAMAPVLGTVALLALVTLWPTQILSRLLSTPTLIYFGKISYSLYLWHFGIIVLFRWTIGFDSLFLQALAAAVSIGLATASLRLVEAPIRFSPKIKTRPDGYVVLRALIGVTGAFAASMAIFYARPHLSLSVTRDSTVWSRFAEDMLVEDGCSVPLREAAIPGGTHISFDPQGCADRSDRRIAVFGESHAISYQTMMQHVAARENVEVDIYTTLGCQPFRFSASDDDGRNAGCRKGWDHVLAELDANLQDGDILFLPGLRAPRFRETGETGIAENSDLDLSTSAADLATADTTYSTLRPLLDRGVRIIVEAPKPLFRTAPFRCSDWYTRISTYCAPGFDVSRSELEERRAPIVAAMEVFAAKDPLITIWDPFPILCPSDTCSAFRDGKPMFYDGDHLSRNGNMLTLPSFLDFLRAVV